MWKKTKKTEKANKVSQILSAISKFLNYLKSGAEQLTAESRFTQILMVAFRKFLNIEPTEAKLLLQALE